MSIEEAPLLQSRERKRDSHTTRAFIATAAAFLAWGVLPIYYKALEDVGPYEVVAHRVVWSAVFSLLLIAARRDWSNIRVALCERGVLFRVLASSVLLGVNWLAFIWAVLNDRVVEVSLGYYICPLASVLLGWLFLRERLSPLQSIAVALALAGVLNLAIRVGVVPYAGLTLAVTFSTYGFLRKTTRLGSLAGLAVETTLLSIPFGAFLIWLALRGQGAIGHTGVATHALVFGTGVVSAVPLIWFAYGAKRLRLATVGLTQYLMPTTAFMLGVFLYNEPFTADHAITFVLVWTALAVYSIDSFLHQRREPGLEKPTGD